MAGVGSKIVFEDDKIKVWEFNLKAGEQTPLHTHELDYIFYVIDGAPLEVFDADGNDLGTLDLKSGDVVPIRIEGDELVVINNPSRRVPVTHSARNTGLNNYRELLIETK